MYHTTPFQNMFFMGFAAFILLFSVTIIIAGIILIHDLPYHIAKRRDHPQQDAIRCMSVMGLVLFPLWLLSMVWAFMRSEVSYVGPKHSKSKVDECDNRTNNDSADVPVEENDEKLDVPDLKTYDYQDDKIEEKEPLKKAGETVRGKTENTDKTQIQE